MPGRRNSMCEGLGWVIERHARDWSQKPAQTQPGRWEVGGDVEEDAVSLTRAAVGDRWTETWLLTWLCPQLPVWPGASLVL